MQLRLALLGFLSAAYQQHGADGFQIPTVALSPNAIRGTYSEPHSALGMMKGSGNDHSSDLLWIPQSTSYASSSAASSSSLTLSSSLLVGRRNRTPTAHKMVAGGAERAYGDEYYDGACFVAVAVWLILE